MCGISAILSTDASGADVSARLERMNASLVHRGPDGQGTRVFSERGLMVGLGHRRLSIIDLAAGAQPMPNEDESIWIAYNGEIYNHQELRAELEACGHRYRTHCDTETILHAYEEWGPECVDRLRGMFAFVIWDSGARTIFGARDRLGIKPLYYTHRPGTLVIGSEIKAILASGLQEAALDRNSLPELMTFGYLSGEETLFDGIKTLLPGHSFTWRDGRFETQQYWDVPAGGAEAGASEQDFVDEFLAVFEESVRLRLMSDVPLGVFLSGGLDSSAIAVVMGGLMQEPLKTFSVGFESAYYSEFGYAREVATAIGADHHEVVMRPGELLAELPRLVWHEDKPIRNSSSVALYFVSRLASEHVKVVLTGEGSDELFAGYSRYWATLFNRRWGAYYERLLPGVVRSAARRTLWKWPLPRAFKRKLSHTFVGHSMCPEELIFDNFHAIFPRRIHEGLFSPEFYDTVREIDPYRHSTQLYNARGRTSAGCANGSGRTGWRDDRDRELDRLLYTDQKTYLVELLMKQDRMSMAASIESRVPFLDHQLVEFAARVPAGLKLHPKGEKYLVKAAMGKRIPQTVRDRAKMGFPVPISDWLHGELGPAMERLLLGPRVRERNVWNPDFVESVIREHRSGRRNHSDALWTLMNFELWARMFLDGERAEDVAGELVVLPEQSS